MFILLCLLVVGTGCRKSLWYVTDAPTWNIFFTFAFLCCTVERNVKLLDNHSLGFKVDYIVLWL